MEKLNGCKLSENVRIVFKTEGKHHFFGYYDKCPWSRDGRFLLALEADFLDRLPGGKDKADIGIINFKGDRVFRKIAETRAWNWQQGSMLQWLGPDYENHVIFNDFRNGEFVSVVLDVKSGKEEKVVRFPIYAIHPNGRYALSLNFSRLDEVRKGYGYKGVSDPSILENKPGTDGIYFVDLKMGKISRIMSLAELCEFKPVNSMSEGKHWVDHLTFSPNGDRFAFLHRWQLKNGGMHSRLCATRLDLMANTGDRKPPPHVLLDSGMASHFTWKSDNELLIWARPVGTPASVGRTGFARRILVPIYHKIFRSSPALRQKISGDSFLLFKFDDETENYSIRPMPIGRGIIKEDGHCSFSPDGEWLLTDTYPGEEHYRRLQLFNLSSQKLVEVGKFRSLPDEKYGVENNWDLSNLRADLHPRFNQDGTQVCIDSVHEGTRQIYVIELSDKL